MDDQKCNQHRQKEHTKIHSTQNIMNRTTHNIDFFKSTIAY